MAIIDVKTYNTPGSYPLIGALSGTNLDTGSTAPTHILRNFRLLEEIVVAAGQRRYFTTLPTVGQLPNNGDQGTVTAGTYASMVFENVGGVLTFRTQDYQPARYTVISAADRDAIGAKLAAGQEYWYTLAVVDGTNGRGFYRVRPDGVGGGVHVGPF